LHTNEKYANLLVHGTEGDYYSINEKQQKYDLYNSAARHDSVLLGFQINSDNFTYEMRRVKSISEKYLDIWKEDNFVELYQEAREVVGEASKELIEELERQIEEWRMLYERE